MQTAVSLSVLSLCGPATEGTFACTPLNGVLAKEPVYRLNGEDATQSMLMSMPLSLSVEEGRIRLAPAF